MSNNPAMQHSSLRQEGRNLPPVQTLSVVSGKGGDGRTTVAINLAMSLAQQTAQVVLFDGNLSMGTIDTALNIKQKFNIADLVADEKDINEICVTGPYGITLVPGCHGNPEMSQLSQIQHQGIINSFSQLRTAADIMLIDNEAGISRSVLDFTYAAREVLLVVCDEPASMQNSFATIKTLSSNKECCRFRVVANKVDSSQHGLEIYSELCRQTDRYLDVLVEYCGCIPFDEEITEASRAGKALTETNSGSRSSRSFQRLAEKIMKWPKPDSAQGHPEFFLERLI